MSILILGGEYSNSESGNSYSLPSQEIGGAGRCPAPPISWFYMPISLVGREYGNSESGNSYILKIDFKKSRFFRNLKVS
jgi:hypothetical protein